ncbi:MAG: peptidase M3 [Candidatus Aminicenantes bacterium RBG_13_63_10]|nr:MAG: peptidase M3 [Candidatus Aminicenantes bacterium RBG_13_63_10]
MKKAILLLVLTALVACSCTKKETPAAASSINPFFISWSTPFETPPFNLIKDADYMPALLEGMARQKAEVEAIASSAEPPTFANTLEALDRSGSLLVKVSNVFFAMTTNNTNDTLQKVQTEVSPLLSRHQDDIFLNARLFERIKAVNDQKASLNLQPEQARLLERIYKAFVRGGANLDDAKKAELRKANEELSVLTVKFGDNLLKDDNGFTLTIDQAEDLAGLPPSVVEGAAEAAKERGLAGKWVFTLHKPSLIPFLQYSDKRDLRQKIYAAYINRGNNNDASDNKAILSRIAALRVKRAGLLGYKTHADYVLEDCMAKTPSGVYGLLEKLWSPSLRMAKSERQALQAVIDREDGGFKLASWDWWYYAEKLRKAKYALDDQLLKPYFKLDDIIQGAFDVANTLWGLQFVERTDIPKYHPDVRTFEMKEADGRHIGIMYTDYFPRASKRGGAWSSAFRAESVREGKKITPVVYNVGNFSMPAGDTPSLLTFEEVKTLFHEFGHALHDLLSDCTYETLTGTNVSRDFVELPSQIMENWAGDPEVVKTYAKHYQTGEPIPQELLDKVQKAGMFNQGFETVEYLAASYLDMDWHTLTDPAAQDALKFEDAALAKIGLIPEIVVRYRSPYFQHIFSGGYSAGYYSYIWSEVLDADAFQAFKETSLFDRATAESFRRNILARGNTEEPMDLFKKFRGREPKVEALLKRRGLSR